MHPRPDLRGRDLAEPEMGGEAGRADRGLVTPVVLGEVVIGEVLEPSACGELARLPRLAQTRGPVGTCRQQLPGIQLVGCHPRPGGKLAGGGQRVAHREFPGRPPERREDLVRLAGVGRDRPRLDEKVRGEAPHLETLVGEPRLQPGVDVAARAVAAVPEHRLSARLGDQGGQHVFGGSAAQHESPAALLDLGGVRGERVVQPPAGRATEGTDAGTLLVEQVQQHDGSAAIQGRTERGVIAETQIVAEPDDRGHDVSLGGPGGRRGALDAACHGCPLTGLRVGRRGERPTLSLAPRVSCNHIPHPPPQQTVGADMNV
jgi:hypothetical protein